MAMLNNQRVYLVCLLKKKNNHNHCEGVDFYARVVGSSGASGVLEPMTLMQHLL